MFTNLKDRSIAHLDLDCFFVSVSRLMNPKLNGKPVIVGGGDRGVVAACSYETRTFGVHSAMPMKTALRLCPEAIVIRGDYDEYSKRSDEITEIIRERVPLFERSSIDEFYIDFSGMDKFYASYQYATELRQRIINETGLPISMGISTNKTVSKVATDEAKPCKQIRIDCGGEKEFLAPLSINKIPMVGEKTSAVLSNMGIKYVHTVQQMPEELMLNVLGENGSSIWRKANGIDNSPVMEYSEQKSMSQEETFDQDSIDVQKMKNILIAMTEKLCFRLRSQNRLTGCVTVKIRYSSFDTYTMQSRLPYTSQDHVIIKRVKELFEKVYSRRMMIRLVGVKFSHLLTGGHQINMFYDSVEVLSLYHSMDKLRLRYGEDKIQRAVALHFPLRGFNPFNGISNSPAAAENSGDSHIAPSIKNLNTLIHLRNQSTMQTANQNPMTGNMYEYLLIISPPENVKKEVQYIKEEFHAKLGHIQAIKSKPHITLVNFAFNTEFEKDLISKIYAVANAHTTFDLKLKNFNHFNTHTIYIGVETEKPIVNIVHSLHNTLTLPSSLSFFSWNPHMTIAKGLTENKFNEAMPSFETKEFKASFITDSILLMKRHHPKVKYEHVAAFFFTN